MDHKPTVILLAGPVTMTDRLRAQTSGLTAIAADSGIRHAIELDLGVELWVGDFDSTPDHIARAFEAVDKRVYPAAKDTSDGNIAIDAALEAGAQSLILVGGLGGETGHALANLTLAVELRKAGIEVLLTSGMEEARPLIGGKTSLNLPIGCGLSIIGLTNLTGLTLGGVRWPLTDRDVPAGSSLTLSNQVTGPVEIGLKGGFGLVVCKLAEPTVPDFLPTGGA